MAGDIAWVQCEDSKCLKWRQLPKYLLDSVRGVSWYCRMNPDKTKAFCELEQEAMKKSKGEEFIFSLLEEGSLVWAKLNGFPRWPAIVSSDLVHENYASFDHDGDLKHYHVEYFGQPRSHSWVLAKNVDIYGSGSAPTPAELACNKGMTSARVRKSFEKAVIQADRLIPLKPCDRLKECTFKPLQDKIKTCEKLSLSSAVNTDEKTPAKYGAVGIGSNADLQGRKRSLNSLFDKTLDDKSDDKIGRSKNVSSQKKMKKQAIATKLTKKHSLKSSQKKQASLLNLDLKDATITSAPNHCLTQQFSNVQSQTFIIQTQASLRGLVSAPPLVTYGSDIWKTNLHMININGQLIPAIIPVNKLTTMNSHDMKTVQTKQNCDDDKSGGQVNKVGNSPLSNLVNSLKNTNETNAKFQYSGACNSNATMTVSASETLKITAFPGLSPSTSSVTTTKNMESGSLTSDISQNIHRINQNEPMPLNINFPDKETLLTSPFVPDVSTQLTCNLKNDHSEASILEEKELTKKEKAISLIRNYDEEEEDLIYSLMSCTQTQKQSSSKSDCEDINSCLDTFDELQNEISVAEKSLFINEALASEEKSMELSLNCQNKEEKITDDILKELDEVEGSIAMFASLL